jgi:HTH-type transcriptional regulator/antitoxin HigA
MMDNIRPIRSDDDLKWAIAEINPYFDKPPEKGTPEADRFDVLADLIEAYENRNFPIDEPEPVEFLKRFMEMTGRTQGDLAELLGSRSRASEILNLKRALTVEMIFKLAHEWSLPADCLVRPYPLAVA